MSRGDSLRVILEINKSTHGVLEVVAWGALRFASAVGSDDGNAVEWHDGGVSGYELMRPCSGIEPLGRADRTGNGFQVSKKRTIS